MAAVALAAVAGLDGTWQKAAVVLTAACLVMVFRSEGRKQAEGDAHDRAQDARIAALEATLAGRSAVEVAAAQRRGALGVLATDGVDLLHDLRSRSPRDYDGECDATVMEWFDRVATWLDDNSPAHSAYFVAHRSRRGGMGVVQTPAERLARMDDAVSDKLEALQAIIADQG